MQADQPLLTIAIPTYNRSKYLQQLLTDLMPQLADQPRVELLISDNASTDETRSMVEAAIKTGVRFRYIRNQLNIGADGNFLQCFEQSSGKYLWIFSDDDVLAEGSIAKIVALISQSDYDLIYVNSYSFDEKGRWPPLSAGAQRAPERFAMAARFAAKVHVFFTFISGNIINKERVLSSPRSNFSDLVGTNLVQLGWTYAALDAHRGCLYVHERLIGNRAGNTGGYALCKIFGLHLSKITRDWLSDAATKRAIINGVITRFFPHHIYSVRMQRDQSSFVSENPHEVLSPLFGRNFRYWLFVYPVIALPIGIARAWVWMGRAVSKVDSLLGNPLLR